MMTHPRPKIDQATLKTLHERNDLHSVGQLAFVYGGIVSLSALVALTSLRSSPFWVAAAICVMGAFQHYLSIIQHEANHFLLFRNRRLNEFFGALSAHFVGFTMDYRQQHFIHHQTLGLEKDPDLHNYSSYPGSWTYFLKDLLFHLSGLAAVLQFLGQQAGGANGNQKQSLLEKLIGSAKRLSGVAATQLAILLYFVLLGYWQGYFLLWILPLLTAAKTLAHFRNAIEHTRRPGELDCEIARFRTIRCNPIEQFFFAPMYFNYHAEHHLYPSVPYYKLPRLHRLLRQQPEYLQCVEVCHGYLRFLFTKGIDRNGAQTDCQSIQQSSGIH